LEGAVKDFVTSATGGLTGAVTLRGSTAAPVIDGKINFDNVSITTLAIGGPLRVDQEALVLVSNKGLTFDRFSVRDSANTPLTLNGTVATTNFINYDLDLTIRGRNFRAINLPRTPNGIYYGKLVLSTNLHVTGTEKAPKVDGSLTINDSTDFTVVIPQTDPGIVSREGVVQFLDFDDPGADSLFRQYDSLNKSTLIGYDITTNLVIDKRAKFNVVIDAANGDFVALQGEANLSVGVDPSGKVNMTGTYEIEQGNYQISYNFLQRKFEIVKGSKITWNGEPTNASLDVRAMYIANTAPLDLVSNQIAETNQAIRNTYLQKLPFQVMLNMGGELMKPQLTFDIQLPTERNYNVNSDIITNVDTRLAQLRQEPSELNKQVFALLLLNRFVGENPFESSGGGGFDAGAMARQSVSKLLTEQLNNLTQNLIAGVDLNFDVASTDDYTTGERRNRTDLNVGVSKRLLNNRLTVSVGSNFELEGPQQSGQQSNNIAGNVAVNYQLSNDGRYALRAYRQNEYFGVVDGYIIETGVRFIVTLDYEKFADIFRRKKKVENRNNRQPENDPMP
ncbi:MAG TPA: translocation/assembly module TamB domain-containing protein, partial [Flavisolibacter sp.]|nr:translocation/assembly module TamB domain-containing protein [Flavisolibacter sp.]